MRDKERQKKAQKAWYKRNKKHMYEKQQAQRAELRRWLREEILANAKCARCPENHIGCLDFHHRNPTEKEIEISDAVDRKWSKERVSGELKKCDILCSNCHRKLHWNEKHGE